VNYLRETEGIPAIYVNLKNILKASSEDEFRKFFSG